MNFQSANMKGASGMIKYITNEYWNPDILEVNRSSVIDVTNSGISIQKMLWLPM